MATSTGLAPATDGQLAELARLGAALEEDVPAGLRRHEAAQRIDEWRRHLVARARAAGAAAPPAVLAIDLASGGGRARGVETVTTSLV